VRAIAVRVVWWRACLLVAAFPRRFVRCLSRDACLCAGGPDRMSSEAVMQPEQVMEALLDRQRVLRALLDERAFGARLVWPA